MTTGAFSQNVGKLFSELKLVTDNLLFNIVAHRSMTLMFRIHLGQFLESTLFA